MERDEPLESLDRTVRRAAQATAAWREALDRDAAPGTLAGQAPLARYRNVAGKTAFDALGERVVLAHDEALRSGLRRWVGALTVLRVTEDERVEQAEAEAEASAEVRLEQLEKTSFRAAWKGFVRSPNAAEADAWLSAIAGRGEAVAAARRERAVREEEAVERLGIAMHADLVGGAALGDVDTAALVFLHETRDLATSLRREAERKHGPGAQASTFRGVVVDACARDAPEGWPARLTLRTLVATLGAPAEIGRGLRIAVNLPEVTGAASFARALASFGEAYRRTAAASSTLPYSVAVDPHFVDAHRFGFAFGALPTTAVYQRRGLGLGTGASAHQARVLAKTALVHARALAASSLLARDAARPDRSRFQELMHDVYGEGVPPSLSGVFPRSHGDASARLQALLTSLDFTRELRDQFDEDWFRNPRAWQFLRARASGPARGPEEAKPAAAPLARAFEEALG
jgi:hypothetical protein